jgi:predicted O-linked N-acetylglucosamine transferase (SPINDLY family)
MNAIEKAKRLVEQGNGLIGAGKLAAALAKFEEALRLLPGHPGVLNNLGVVLEKLGRLEEALDKYETVRRLTPPHPGLLNNCGVVLRKLNRSAEALERFDQALKLKPDYAEALANRGKLLVEQLNRPADGLASYDRSLQSRPDHADTWSNRAIALARLDRVAEALASNDRALALDPRHADALHNRAGLLEGMKRFDEAARAWERVLEVMPDRPYMHGRLLHARLQCCDWHDYDALRARIEDGVAHGRKEDAPWHMSVHCRSPELLLRCAEIFTADQQPAASTPLWNGERYGHDRFRIAWLSGGFGNNVEAQTVAGLIEHHDRTRFETFGISVGLNDNSPMRARMEAAFEHFVDARSWTDEQTARWLRAREIDILVIVAAYMTDSRLGILRHRPAPLQVNFAFLGSIGADYVDYMLADRHVVPADQEGFFREKPLRPAEAMMGYYAPPEIAGPLPSRASFGLPDSGFVFCCFNNNYKIQPDTFAIWMGLLRDIEGSVLWLREANAMAKANLQAEAARQGIAADRLVFAPFAPSYDDHLARFGVADLFVDAPPYNAHTTACEALWAGLPLVTCSGATAVSRVAGGLLHASGLGELVAGDLADYDRRIRALVAAPHRLAAMRAQLARARTAGVLFNPAGFCRDLEAAFLALANSPSF